MIFREKKHFLLEERIYIMEAKGIFSPNTSQVKFFLLNIKTLQVLKYTFLFYSLKKK